MLQSHKAICTKLRAKIAEMQTSSNGDERMIGDALHGFTHGIPDERLMDTLRSSMDGLIEALESFGSHWDRIALEEGE